MRCLLGAILILLLPGGLNSARSQVPKRQPFLYGWGDAITHVADVPPMVRIQLKKQFERDLAVGFHYHHFYLFAEGFDLWTWGGQFVLFQKNEYFTATDDDFVMLLGKEKFESLRKPFVYVIPPGLATMILGILAIIVVAKLFPSARARAAKLNKDPRYVEALEVFVRNLPDEGEASPEEKQHAMKLGAEFLTSTHGIAPEKAMAHLRLIIREMERARSYELRGQAAGHEMAEEWDEALEHYRLAAKLQQDWDAKDYLYLLKCIERVEAKKARAPKTDEETLGEDAGG
jgi:hypothetical protein